MTLHRTLEMKAREYRRGGRHVRCIEILTPGGHVVVNNLEFTRWEPSGFEVIQCSECLGPGCSGRYLVARRYGGALAWIPAVDLIQTHGALDCGPPHTGSPDWSYLFVGEALQLVQEGIAGHPPLADLPPVSNEEVADILCQSAPRSLLKPLATGCRMNRETLVYAHPLPLEEALDFLDAFLAGCDGEAKVPHPDSVPVDLFLDESAEPPWTPICRTPNGELLAIPFGRDSLAVGL